MKTALADGSESALWWIVILAEQLHNYNINNTRKNGKFFLCYFVGFKHQETKGKSNIVSICWIMQ
jgi:hypothetical protein